jgi:hypothetical protein
VVRRKGIIRLPGGGLSVMNPRLLLLAFVCAGLIGACSSTASPGPNTPSPTAEQAPTDAATPAVPTALGGSAGPSGNLPVLTEGPLAAGTYVVPPGRYGWANCEVPPPSGCPTEPPHAQTMLVEITIPDGGWEAGGEGTVIASPRDGALVLRWSGLTTGLHSDPCLPVSHMPTDIKVGVTVDDFVDAVVAHPVFQVSEPVDTELDGYPGRLFTLTGPPDISDCDNWRPWEPGISQGRNDNWNVWVIDVEGLRVILVAEESAGVPAEVKRDLKQMVESIRFVPRP